MLEAVRNDKKLRNHLIGALKRVWHRHPTRRAILDQVRVEIIENKKDGTPRARPSVFYRCVLCHTLAKAQRSKLHPQIHIDHIDPVVPLEGYDALSWGDYIYRLFTSPENLQAICSTCHDSKTSQERVQRVAQRKDKHT